MELELDLKQGMVLWKTTYEKAKEDEIGWKMLENNQIEGLLPFDYYYIDDLICFRYSYYSLQRVEDYFQKKNAGYESLYLLCEGVLKVIEKGAEYLLSSSGYLVSPEWIFWNRCEKKVFLCYLPGRGEELQKGYTTLVEYLMEHTDHSDKSAVVFIYGLYDMLTSENFVLENVLDYIRNMHNGVATVQRQGSGEPDKSVDIVADKMPVAQNANIAANKIPDENIIISSSQGYILKKVREKGKENITDMVLQSMKNTSFVIEKGEVTVGRQQESALYLPFTSISKKQALLFCEDGELYVMDAASKNGTYLNQNKISAYVRTKCKEGDVITFADISYQVCKYHTLEKA